MPPTILTGNFLFKWQKIKQAYFILIVLLWTLRKSNGRLGHKD